MLPLASLEALADFVKPQEAPKVQVTVEIPGIQELIDALTNMREKARGVQPLPG